MAEPSATKAMARPASPSARDGASMRLLAIAGGLAVALVAGFALGEVVRDSAGPTGSAPMGRPPGASLPASRGTGHQHAGGAATTAAGAEVGGLAVSAGGYTLAPETTSLTAGARSTWRFRVIGPDSKPVTNFAIVHDKPMHLIVARRDFSGYQHLHPTMAPDGTWSVDLLLPQAGAWRAYADFATVGSANAQVPLTLGADLTVPGDFRPLPLPAASRESIVDGFAVTYEGTPRLGETQALVFRVSRDGSPVADLQRYLGAYGHLVVLREGDLGYVHVHPEQRLLGGAVKFWLTATSPGRYRMFFDFQVGGRVHTAEFTLVVR
ncbi:hypothetical protein [Micromonospora sp. NPDC007230]|uniref:hypothetical protein n=1 Tax=Micromonospora sp. NPDC007230 TaxID=3364237 RepID=UPI0036BCF2BD